MARTGIAPGISGSQGKRPNHWAVLPHQDFTGHFVLDVKIVLAYLFVVGEIKEEAVAYLTFSMDADFFQISEARCSVFDLR